MRHPPRGAAISDGSELAADPDRAVAGSGYRDAVSMVLKAGERPLLLEDPAG
ncbi:MAG: hypothetical protein GWN25_40995 [Actinobacteria bacterium]|nr:hypothetical protein [Actinomycetota bacterium]